MHQVPTTIAVIGPSRAEPQVSGRAAAPILVFSGLWPPAPCHERLAGTPAVHPTDQWSAAKYRVAYDVVFISDTVRGLLLDLKNEADNRGMRSAQAGLAAE